MVDAVIVAENAAPNSGYRFSWGLAIAGGVAATAVTFFLLMLGSGFGLLLLNPASHNGPSAPTFLTGGAIYFFVAQAFGFAVGGHLAGRLLGPLVESGIQEEFRAAAHGFVAWAVAILATLTVVAILAAAAAGAGATTAALYGMGSASGADTKPTNSSLASYFVDVLFRPSTNPAAAMLSSPRATRASSTGAEGAFIPTVQNRLTEEPNAIPISQQTTAPQSPDTYNPPANSGPAELTPPNGDDESGASQSIPPGTSQSSQSSGSPSYSDTQVPNSNAPNGGSANTAQVQTSNVASSDPRGEARRILEMSVLRGEQMNADDRSHLIMLVSSQADISQAQAATRIDKLLNGFQSDTRRAADFARKAASYASLWIALSLLFGAIVSVFAATSARIEDDRDAVRAQ